MPRARPSRQLHGSPGSPQSWWRMGKSGCASQRHPESAQHGSVALSSRPIHFQPPDQRAPAGHAMTMEPTRRPPRLNFNEDGGVSGDFVGFFDTAVHPCYRRGAGEAVRRRVSRPARTATKKPATKPMSPYSRNRPSWLHKARSSLTFQFSTIRPSRTRKMLLIILLILWLTGNLGSRIVP
jgi:hypothetical protein